MRKPNGYGSIKKLSGKRRRPYVFLISAEGKQKPLAYFATQVEAEIYAAEYKPIHVLTWSKSGDTKNNIKFVTDDGNSVQAIGYFVIGK